MTTPPRTPTTAAGKRFCEGPRPTGNWWKGVPDQIAAIEAEARAAPDPAPLDETPDRAALLDIERWTKPGSVYMDGTNGFPSGSHLTARIHNRVRQVFGEEPLRWADRPSPDPAPLDVERLARALADLMCWTSHGTRRPPRHRPCEPHLSRATQMAQSWREDWSPIRLAPEEAKP